MRSTTSAPRRVLLRGFYGQANLGDDVLLVSTRRWVARHWPDAKVYVASTAQDPGYLTRLVPGIASIVRAVEPLDFELTVDGGGGVYFGFERGQTHQRWFAAASASLGAETMASARARYRQLMGRPGARQSRRVGIGIGVGEFAHGSPRLPHALANLGEVDALMVRDAQSVTAARRLRSNLEVYEGADLAFAGDLWDAPPATNVAERRGVGFVLRDWPYDGRNDYARVTIDVVRRLQDAGIEVVGYALSPLTDGTVVEMMRELGAIHVWNPEIQTPAEFVGRLGRHQLVVSSRAHGAILSAVVGVPSIVIALESKLRVVADMLSRSARLVDVASLATVLEPAVHERLEHFQTLAAAAQQDVAALGAKVASSLDRMAPTAFAP